MTDQTAIKITQDAEAIREVRDAIVEILGTGNEEKTIRLGLSVLMKAATVSNVTISGNTMTMNRLPE